LHFLLIFTHFDIYFYNPPYSHKHLVRTLRTQRLKQSCTVLKTDMHRTRSFDASSLKAACTVLAFSRPKGILPSCIFLHAEASLFFAHSLNYD